MSSVSPAPRGWRDGFLPPFPHSTTQGGFGRYDVVIFALIALIGGAGIGWLSVTAGPLVGVAGLAALAGAVIVVSDARAALWVTLGIVTLLPFAVIPVRVGLTLTLFEVAAMAAIGVWLLRLLLYRDERFAAGTPALWVALLLAMTLFALVLGVGRGYTSATFHDYGKFVLAILLFYVVWNTVASLDDARRMVTVLVLGTSVASLLGLILYIAGPAFSERVLSRLIPYGYPADRIVRYIEDDPARPMRMVSTSVDPNSFGGLLAVVFVIVCTQAICRHPVLPRVLSIGAVLLIGPAMMLTYSRGAWVAAAAGLAVVALLGYRWLVLPGALAGAVVAAFGLGAVFIERMWLGLTLQDPATRLRLAEYRNAIAIIREHPLFGVGFGDAPSIELQTGVSSIYLAIAQRAGLIGLLVFLIAVCLILLAGLRHWQAKSLTAEGDLSLSLLAGLVAALTVGFLDHYFFNITFPHMAGLFWTVAGLLVALALPVRRATRSDQKRLNPQESDSRELLSMS